MRWRLQYLVAFLLLLSSVQVQAAYVGPTREGLSFHVSAVPSEIYLPNEVISNEAGNLFPTMSRLTVRVLDVNQRPVDGVPVTFELAPSCKSIASLTPVRVLTRDGGVASATVGVKDSTGMCRITVQVDNVMQVIRIAISPAPEAPSAPSGEDRR